MSKKLKYLIRMSLDKKIKTKSFLIANIIFAILIVGLINIDHIIEFFGGDFDNDIVIYFYNNSDYNDNDKIESIVLDLDSYLEGEISLEIISSYDDALLKIKDNSNILLTLDNDYDNYLKATITTDKSMDSILYTTLVASINNIKKEYALSIYGIDDEIVNNINKTIEVERVKLSDDGDDNDIFASVILPIITLPLFILIIFLVQMIGAEINEEKATRGMEIIISNVSPTTHFISKLVSSNTFVLLQSILLIVYFIFGVMIRGMSLGSFNISSLVGESNMGIVNSLNISSSITINISVIIIMIILIILSFIGYSLVAAILASMTTSMEDYQQVQGPIVIISLMGYYLSLMSSLFSGSLFIRICSYIPFISTLLSPVLYLTNSIGIIDVLISIILMIFTIYILVKYGLRIYKVGILNYSNSNIWKRLFRAYKDDKR